MMKIWQNVAASVLRTGLDIHFKGIELPMIAGCPIITSQQGRGYIEREHSIIGDIRIAQHPGLGDSFECTGRRAER